MLNNLDNGESSALKNIVATSVTALTLTVAFGLLSLNVSFSWVVFVIGFGAIMPLSMALAEYYEDKETERSNTEVSNEKDDALEELKRQFVNNEITEEEFENQVETLIQTDNLENAENYVNSKKDRKQIEKELNKSN